MDALRPLGIALLFLLVAAAESPGRPVSGTEEAGLWRVRSGQTIMGAFGGALGAVLGAAAGLMLVPPCTHEDEPGEAATPWSAREGNCGSHGIVAGFVLGAIGGTSGGIYLVGRGSGGEGSYPVTAGGAAAGLAAYHITDRVRLGVGQDGASAEVVLARF